MSKRSLVILFSILIISLSPSVLAEVTSQADGEDSFNIVGYAILGVAVFGWLFFLNLVVTAIYLIIRKRSRRLYVPENPIKCK